MKWEEKKRRKERESLLHCTAVVVLEPRQIMRVHDFINLLRNELNPCMARTHHTTPRPNNSVSNKLHSHNRVGFSFSLRFVSHFIVCHRETSFGVHCRHSCNTISRSLFHPLLNCSSSSTLHSHIACLETYSSKTSFSFVLRRCLVSLYPVPYSIRIV